MPLFGAHMSIAGGCHNALLAARDHGCDSVQLFVSPPKVWPVKPPPEGPTKSRSGKLLTKNSNQWRGKDLTDDEVRVFRRLLRQTKLRYPTAHDSYLINLASPDEALYRRSVEAFVVEMQRAERLGLRYLVSGRPLTEAVLGELRALLAGRVSVLVGHSGVGKSTLVNALIPEASRAVGTVSPVTGRGRHTSSSVVALRLPGGGWIVDTPGLRSFGLGHIAADRVVQAFPDLAEGVAGCPPGCHHLTGECALDDWVAEHDQTGALAARLDSLRRLLRSREGGDDT